MTALLKRLLHYLRILRHITEGFHRTVIVRILLGILRVALMLGFIWFSRTAIDCATGRVAASDGELIMWFSFMAGCILSEVIISQVVKYITGRATMVMTNRITRRLFNTLMVMPLVNGGQGFHSGDMLNRLTLDVRTVTDFALSQLPALIIMVIQLTGAFIFLACLNPYLALAPVIIMPVALLGSKLYFRRNRRLTAALRDGEGLMAVTIQEGLQHRMVLKSLMCIPEMDRRLGVIQQTLDSTNKEQKILSTLSNGIVSLGFVTGYLVAFGWSVFSLKAGLITFGTMSAFIQLVSRIQNPIAGIAGYVPTFISASVALDRLRDVEALRGDNGASCLGVYKESEEKAMGNSEESEERVGVRVRDLSFRYEEGGKDILSRFSYDFRPGSRTMIVGSTGAGKTTLVKLLLGLLRPDSGSVEVYGDTGGFAASRGEGPRQGDLNNEQEWCEKVSEDTLSNFVYVPQGNTLLHGTIRDNLLLSDPEASDARLREVLHVAAADFVFELPQGLDTLCDETGGGLSEGQAQRIAIARALLRPGSVLLLDEFNSALDLATAETLMSRLAANRPHATIIIIAHHRDAVAPYCDAVLRIREQ